MPNNEDGIVLKISFFSYLIFILQNIKCFKMLHIDFPNSRFEKFIKREEKINKNKNHLIIITL